MGQQEPLYSCQRKGKMSDRVGRKGGSAPRQFNLGPWMICGGQGRSVGFPSLAGPRILVLSMKKVQPQNQPNSSPSTSPRPSNLHQIPSPLSQRKKHGIQRKLGKKPGMFSFPLSQLHAKKKITQHHHPKGKILPMCFLHQHPEFNPVITFLFQRRSLRSLIQMSLIHPGLLG